MLDKASVDYGRVGVPWGGCRAEMGKSAWDGGAGATVLAL